MTPLTMRLIDIVGADYCLSGEAPRDKYDHDITQTYKGRSLCVVRPANSAEVAAVMALAHETKTPVIPLSGNTGLAGGGYAGEGARAIILSLERMNKIREINTQSHVAVVEAGVILANLHAAVEAHNLIFPLMFGARGSCMIGGNLATNAGGSNVVRYGNTRALCLGLEVVLADGEIVNLMSQLHKDNTGYALKDLFIGSEGTLGVITAAVLKLFPRPSAYATAMISVPDIESALSLLHRVQAESGGAVEAFEYMPANYFDYLKKMRPESPMPFASPAETGILIEVAATSKDGAMPDENGRVPVVAQLEDLLGEMLESGLVLDATIAKSDAQRAEMWHQREMAFEVSMSQGVPITADVSVPLDKVATFLERANSRLKPLAPNAEVLAIAHLGDGNLHYSLWTDPEAGTPATPDLKTAIFEMIEDVVAELGGSFSAEHGIGLSKLGSMARRKDKAALSVMQRIKRALDPDDIMNPGKLLP